MAKSISNYTSSNYGIGVTGKLNRADSQNNYGNDDDIYFCIYDKDYEKYYERKLRAIYPEREKNKKYILDCVLKEFDKIIK